MLIKKDLENLRKELKDDLETAIAQIVDSIVKTVSTKEEFREFKEEMKEFKEEVRGEFKEVKRQINDLKVDLPTPQEFADHEKRITKLETAAFPQ